MKGKELERLHYEWSTIFEAESEKDINITTKGRKELIILLNNLFV